MPESTRYIRKNDKWPLDTPIRLIPTPRNEIPMTGAWVCPYCHTTIDAADNHGCPGITEHRKQTEEFAWR